ncbi:MAG: VanZ family protein [Prevotella sp.]|nr:VanZ family protein [Prevotella sp.]
MKYIIKVAKRYPLSCLCVVVIWILCFCTPPHTPLDNVKFIDKWTHITMYAGTGIVIWYEYLKKHDRLNKIKLFVWAWLAPILMSGAIEILQEYCTNGRRSGDWLDFAANASGATLAAFIGILVAMYRTRQ